MHLPFDLQPGSSVLVAGAGGGYDIVCGLPIAIALRQLGHTVHLASYSFSRLDEVQNCEQPFPHLYAVTSASIPPANGYFPEGYLAQWWAEEFQEEQTVWSYHQVGVKPLAVLLAQLCQKIHLDAIVLVDGGVDGLFEGTEFDIATPTIDTISIFSAYQLSHLKSYYAFTAFGTEGRDHKVRHADALMRIAQQVALGGMLGVSALLPHDPPGRGFLQAVEHVHRKCGARWHSNMASSVAAAMKGRFGYHDLTAKTTESKIWVSPLTLLYWFFQLPSIAEVKPFRRKALETETVEEMAALIQSTREASQILPRSDIPI